MLPHFSSAYCIIAAVLSIVQISYTQNRLEQNIGKTFYKDSGEHVTSYHSPQAKNLRSTSGEYSEYPDYEADVRQDRKYQLEYQTPRNQEPDQSANSNVIHNRSSMRRSKEHNVETAAAADTLHMVDNWPDANKQLGQLSAVSLDVDGNVVVFHRGDRVWNSRTFLADNVYSDISLGPIVQNTIVTFHASSGMVLHEWGNSLFYMPHGITVDFENNVWITDVALHQVFKFGPNGGLNAQPLLTLGVRFTPGKEQTHFCKPTDVAIMLNGDFFVSDGYCNSRVIKYSPSGEFLMDWGRSTFYSSVMGKMPLPYEFNVPHALALAEDKSMLCVADRENGRVQCFNCHNGTFVMQLYSPILGKRIFSVAYSPARGGLLYVVNGPDPQTQRAAGFEVSLASNQIVEFQPADKTFSNPHDVAVSSDGKHVYVVELNPYRVWRFDQGNVNANTSSDAPLKSEPVTATTLKMPLGAKKPSVSSMNLSKNVESLKTAQEPATIATAVGIILVIIVVVGLVLTAAVIRMKKRGYLSGYSSRSKRWEFPKSPVEGFKLGQFLDRHQGFEKVNTEESDDDGSNSSSEIIAQHPQFA